MAPSPLLQEFLPRLRDSTPVLDLACGGGRNGLFLLGQGLEVVFADRSAEALDRVKVALQEQLPPDAAYRARLWQADFEADPPAPLGEDEWGAILVFRYLHRPLLPAIRRAICPGGLLVYETFTTEQPRFGRPHNPDFLLRPGELQDAFGAWEILYSFEGVVPDADGSRQQAIARLVARRP